ncbi:hypothetical protein V3C99_014642 [Haemonchus contortus]|nr:unnamed protein product [Haemonchus contortus]
MTAIFFRAMNRVLFFSLIFLLLVTQAIAQGLDCGIRCLFGSPAEPRPDAADAASGAAQDAPRDVMSMIR